ncbi:cadherin-related family member 5-like [Thalassophryne amazonica]|uniref:cadherin-related family member 5-like n=1 Tax=Thalassophryne amazonica TaxID=390379 RepID=UPI0014714B37|nr:cadherin-related family member 5-like [Thalassophryne amazonica]
MATAHALHIRVTLMLESQSNSIKIRSYFYVTTAGFKMLNPSSDKIVIEKLLHFESVKTVRLTMTAQDTPLPPADVKPSYTATTTILVNITDIDNRPPWFQPCTKHSMGEAVICQDAGYTGNVDLNEQEVGALPLKPGPLYAVDGDESINAPIMYSFLGENPGGLFDINSTSGNITMTKATDVLGPIDLTVLAAQLDNQYQFATTTVTISVRVKSLHPPRFEKQQYDGVVAAAGTMVMDMKNKEEPLKILAIDEDYAGAGGLNPKVIYSVTGSSAFSIISGYMFLTESLPAGTLSLQVEAVDESNGESATAQLSVEVTAGLSSTTVRPSTPDITSPTPTEETSTNVSTTDPSVSTTGPSVSTTGPNVSTANPSATSDIITSSTNPSGHTGEFGTEDMLAVGITLGILLLISLVVIGLLVYQIQIGKTEWKKIYEASVFRSTLGQGPGSQKMGIQYTNDGFYKDEEDGSVASSGPDAGGAPQVHTESVSLQKSAIMSMATLNTLLPDNESQAGSDRTDSEKEVKPILTKDRRSEDGYKSVWFKEDIDPNAKQDVVIIPDSREDNEDEDWDDGGQDVTKGMPKVVFSDTDLDSGLGMRLEDQMDDSDENEVL